MLVANTSNRAREAARPSRAYGFPCHRDRGRSRCVNIADPLSGWCGAPDNQSDRGRATTRPVTPRLDPEVIDLRTRLTRTATSPPESRGCRLLLTAGLLPAFWAVEGS